MKRIILSGANGFIGKNILNHLKGVDIDVIDREKGMDISDSSWFHEFKDSYHAFIHLAGKTDVVASFSNPAEFYRINTIGTLNIAKFCKEKHIPLVIYANSYPYGVPNYLPVNETHPINPQSPYQRSKQFAEDLLLDCSHITTVSCRLFNVYGPNQPGHLLIPEIIEQVLGDQYEIEVKDLMPKRDYIYVEDVVNLFSAILDARINHSTIINVGTGKSHSVKDVIDQVQKVLGTNKPIQSKNNIRKNEVSDCYANITKAYDLFGWAPKYQLNEGLKKWISQLKIK